MKPVKIYFSQGTLLLDGSKKTLAPVANFLEYDERVKRYRAPAYQYAPVVIGLHLAGVTFDDQAKDFSPLALIINSKLSPRPHQEAALEAWLEEKGRGLVVMPTGTGKSYLAMLAMTKIQRPTLIVVPTIDLMQQWASKLEQNFSQPIGMLGGGSKEITDITVSTYDSAVLQMEFIGNRFGMVVFDECHHLPGPVNRLAASMCLAPYRLGLTATPEREDDGEEVLDELIGPLAYRIHIDELEKKVLSPYITKRVNLVLDPDEAEKYNQERAIYTGFLKQHRIHFSQKTDWNRFLILCSRMPNGRRVLEAYLKQKRIARNSRSKLRKVWELIREHRHERIIVFTAENEMAYELGRQFLLPVLTHRTKAAERKDFLDRFRSGEYPVLLTSKVLNEGVDVPEASVGIVVSGSGSTREHVQRLGRILRAQQGKQAILYELVTQGTSEMNVSRRRRHHRAYRKKWNK